MAVESHTGGVVSATQSEREALRRIGLSLAFLILITLIGTLFYKWRGGADVTYLDALYMTVITVSTVGFQEMIDLSHDGPARIFTIVLIFFGLGVLLYSLSAVTAFFVEGQLAHLYWRKRMQKQIAQKKDHLIICGAGNTGGHIIRRLAQQGVPFDVVEKDPECVELLRRDLPDLPVVVGDATDDRVLEQAGIQNARGLMSVVSNDRDNVYIILSARSLNPNLRIVARAQDASTRDKMYKVGADSVVTPDHIGAARMVGEMTQPAVSHFIESLLLDNNAPYSLGEYLVSAGSSFAGQNVGQATDQIRARSDLDAAIVAIRSASGDYKFNPVAEDSIAPGSTLILLGSRQTLERVNQLST